MGNWVSSVPVQQGGNDNTPANAFESFVLESLNERDEKVDTKKLRRLLDSHNMSDLFNNDVLTEWKIDDTPDGKKGAYVYIYTKLSLLIMIRELLETQFYPNYHVDMSDKYLVQYTNDMTKLTVLYNQLGMETFQSVESNDPSIPSKKILMWKDIYTSKESMDKHDKTFKMLFTRYK